ncbi:MAG: SH3 domain-containing protein [Pseudomonadota bacterium]
MKILLIVALAALPFATLADTVVPADNVESYVNIRNAPESGAEVVGRLQQGDSLPFVATTDGWNEVALDDGSSGFISADWTRVLVEDIASVAREDSVTEASEEPVESGSTDGESEADADDVVSATVAPEPETVPTEVGEVTAEPAATVPPVVEATPVANAEPIEAAVVEPEPAADPPAAPVADDEPAAVVPVVAGPAGPAGPPGPPGPAGPPGTGGIKGKPGYLVRFKEESDGESSQVFDNGNQVGIGTIEPKQRLEVNGSVQIHDRNSAVAGLMITQADGDTGYIMHNRANTLTIGAGSEDRMTIDRNGNVGIGELRPVHPIHMASGAHVSAGGVWVNSSSRAEKDNISSLTIDEAMAVLDELEPVHFSYRADGDEAYVGFIAEDVPDLVATADRKGLASMDIVAVLTRVIQAQQQQIDALEARLDAQQ